jgi:hypothetical protein
MAFEKDRVAHHKREARRQQETLRHKKMATTQASMMDGENGTTKYVEGAKFAV